MRYIFFGFFVLMMNVLHAQQFRYDNVQFKTVYPEDLCKTLQEHPDALLLDVRSMGEYYDTSVNKALNLGHFKNAKNITIGELGQRWHEVESYKTKPVFIYCSHSQRSRRAAHLLADSGFTNIYNINGGMTQLLKMRNKLPDCFNALYETSNKYKIVSAAQLIEQSKKKIPWFIIDLRSDSVYKAISLQEKKNAMGRLQPAENILYSHLEGNLSKIPQDKPVLLIDEFGGESPLAAELLMNIGYKDVSVLLNGMDGWMQYNINEKPSNPFKWKAPQEYTIISGSEFDNMMNTNKPYIIDVRPAEHFTNASKNSWENIGHVQNAVNIPIERFSQPDAPLPASKDELVVLYTFNDQNNVYEAARKLKNKGYKNVYVLYGGIYNLRWAAHNVKGKNDLVKWVVDVPADNQ